jgi:hypothetical protein
MRRERDSASDPPPENIATAGCRTEPKTKGISSAWHDPRIPPNAGVSWVKRYTKVLG